MAEQQKLNTSTQIRTLYSHELSYMSIKFYNTSLSFSFVPFLNKNANGRNTYDTSKSLMTTINYENAFALYKMGMDIINGDINIGSIRIECAYDTFLTLERKQNMNGQLETIFTINKNKQIIAFKFATQQYNVMENNVMVTKTYEHGLGAFTSTIYAYLIGINADRHLDKLTEDYIKIQENKQTSNNTNNTQYKKPWQNNNYKNNYKNNNTNYSQQQTWETNATQQNMTSYQLPN